MNPKMLKLWNELAERQESGAKFDEKALRKARQLMKLMRRDGLFVIRRPSVKETEHK